MPWSPGLRKIPAEYTESFEGYIFPHGFVNTEKIGSISFRGAKILGAFSISCPVKGDLALSYARVVGETIFSATDIGGVVDLCGCVFEQGLFLRAVKANGFRMDELEVLKDLKFYRCECHGEFLLQNAQISGRLLMREALIVGRFMVSNAAFVDASEISRCNFLGQDSEPFKRELFDAGMSGSSWFGEVSDCIFESGLRVIEVVFGAPICMRNTSMKGIRFQGVDLRFVFFINCSLLEAILVDCLFFRVREPLSPKGSGFSLTLDAYLLYAHARSFLKRIRIEPKAKSDWGSPIFDIPGIEKLVPYDELAFVLWVKGRGGARIDNQFESVMRQQREMKVLLEQAGSPVEAGEFYFGEMELRRHYGPSGSLRSPVRRWLSGLNMYRVIAGYGERPWRSAVSLFLLYTICAHSYLMLGLYVGKFSAEHGRYTYRWVNYDYAWRLPDVRGLTADYPSALEFAARKMLPFIERGNAAVKPGGLIARALSLVQQALGFALTALLFVGVRRRYRR